MACGVRVSPRAGVFTRRSVPLASVLGFRLEDPPAFPLALSREITLRHPFLQMLPRGWSWSSCFLFCPICVLRVAVAVVLVRSVQGRCVPGARMSFAR